jgi:TetR/AcrR family transcriptional repressor of uid operon
VNVRAYVQRERARRTARTTAAIEAAAIREVVRRGFAGLRVADVARRARVAPRTVYLHAPTKERLVDTALRRRAAALTGRVERWHPRSDLPETVLNELVAWHERNYREESALLEALVAGGVPRPLLAILRDLDAMRLAVITRTLGELARRGALRVRLADAVALAHALLAYPTWRTALTGPARRRAPRLVASALRSALL